MPKGSFLSILFLLFSFDKKVTQVLQQSDDKEGVRIMRMYEGKGLLASSQDGLLD